MNEPKKQRGQPRKWPNARNRTIRIPDNFWNQMPDKKSDFVNAAIKEKLEREK